MLFYCVDQSIDGIHVKFSCEFCAMDSNRDYENERKMMMHRERENEGERERESERKSKCRNGE